MQSHKSKLVLLAFFIFQSADAVTLKATTTISIKSASTSPNGLCDGLVQDKKPHPLVNIARPEHLKTIVDPAFGTVIRRITNATSGQTIKTAYSTVPAFNSNESFIMLWDRQQGHILLDGSTYLPIRVLPIEPNDLEQVHWDPIDPDVLYYPKGRNLNKYSVSTGKSTLVHDFSAAPTGCTSDVSFGPDPQYMSWGSEKVTGLACGNKKIIYAISNDVVLGTKTITTDLAPVVGPSGTHAILNGTVYSSGFLSQRTLDIASFEEHASIGRNLMGQDVYNMISFDGSFVGTLVSYNMNTGSGKVIVGPSTGYPYPPGSTHLSSVAIKNPGWVTVSIVGNVAGSGVLDQEIILANVDTGTVCRVAHHRSYGKSGKVGYFAEPHPVISPKGTRILFSSDWRNSGQVDTFVIELPGFR